MLDELGDDRRLGQERIDPLGLEALEVVPAAQRPAEIGRELRLDPLDLASREQTRDDDVAMLLEVLDVRLDRSPHDGAHRISIYPE